MIQPLVSIMLIEAALSVPRLRCQLNPSPSYSSHIRSSLALRPVCIPIEAGQLFISFKDLDSMRKQKNNASNPLNLTLQKLCRVVLTEKLMLQHCGSIFYKTLRSTLPEAALIHRRNNLTRQRPHNNPPTSSPGAKSVARLPLKKL